MYREEVVVLELGVKVVKLGVKICRNRSGRTNQLNSQCLFLFFVVFPPPSVHQEEKEMFHSFFLHALSFDAEKRYSIDGAGGEQMRPG